MSNQSQIANMKALARLLKQDLAFAYGPKENGPNGAKKEFLTKGRAFLTALGKDLGFSKKMVRVNAAGVAVSGDVSLKGIWSADNGLDLVLEKPTYGIWAIRYRTIKGEKDFVGGPNNFICADWLERGDYDTLVEKLTSFRKGADSDVHAA